VEELLRDDRRLEVGLRKGRPLVRVVGPTALEVRPHVGDVDPHDLVAVDAAHLAAVVRDELQPQILRAARA
jgi:hypothetical protein